MRAIIPTLSFKAIPQGGLIGHLEMTHLLPLLYLYITTTLKIRAHYSKKGEQKTLCYGAVTNPKRVKTSLSLGLI